MLDLRRADFDMSDAAFEQLGGGKRVRNLAWSMSFSFGFTSGRKQVTSSRKLERRTRPGSMANALSPKIATILSSSTYTRFTFTMRRFGKVRLTAFKVRIKNYNRNKKE